jgi:hypothetical protein
MMDAHTEALARRYSQRRPTAQKAEGRTPLKLGQTPREDHQQQILVGNHTPGSFAKVMPSLSSAYGDQDEISLGQYFRIPASERLHSTRGKLVRRKLILSLDEAHEGRASSMERVKVHVVSHRVYKRYFFDTIFWETLFK